jgi:hypothetical protein
MEGETGDNMIECALDKRQRCCCPLLPSDVGQFFFQAQRLGAFQHGRDHIETGNVPGFLGKRTSDESGPAGYIQDFFVGANATHFNQQLEQFSV